MSGLIETHPLSHSKESMCESLTWISRLGRKSSLEMPSKHFLRWGCTRSGSLVSDRISSISSLDKKKNLAATFGAKPLIWYVKKRLGGKKKLLNLFVNISGYRGKNRRFFSKYALSPFIMLSRRLLESCSFSSRPGSEVAGRTYESTSPVDKNIHHSNSPGGIIKVHFILSYLILLIFSSLKRAQLNLL